MKKPVLCFVMAMLILCSNISLVNASDIEKGNPAATYSHDVRLIAQELGASVDWDGKNRDVTITQSQKEIVLAIDRNVALVNGIEVDLDYPTILYKDLTYVPLRFVAENLDAAVHYSPRWVSPKFTYYYDTKMPVSPADTIIRNYTNIIVIPPQKVLSTVT